jgi:uncharacterized circularly permuted ATP-grasp superfamily protein
MHQTGVVDDKAFYAYIPRIIKYYLGGDIYQCTNLYL